MRIPFEVSSGAEYFFRSALHSFGLVDVRHQIFQSPNSGSQDASQGKPERDRADQGEHQCRSSTGPDAEYQTRWTLHFTPTSCSWTDAVEGFFGKLANRRLRRGVHDSLEDLKAAVDDFIELHNGKETKPFKWMASPDRLVAARQRGFQMTRTSH